MATCLHQPFLPPSDLPYTTVLDPSQPVIASAHTCISFDFAEEELNTLRNDLKTDKVFSHTYGLLLSGSPSLYRFEMANGILYWRLYNGRLTTCMPASMVQRVLAAAYESFGHWGFEKNVGIREIEVLPPRPV